MIQTTSRNKQKAFSTVAAVLFAAASVLGLQGCGGGGSSTPPPIVDQVASGLFKSGTAELDASAVMADDLRAFVHGNRIIAFSISQHILFDGEVTAITGDDFTATVNLYETGVMTQADIAVTGKVTSQSQITGTLAGTGVGSGTFTLVYDNTYETPADFVKADATGGYEGTILTTYSFPTDDTTGTTDNLGLNVNGDINSNANDYPITINCEFDGTSTIPLADKSLISITQDIKSTSIYNDSCPLDKDPIVKYTGFASQLSETGTGRDILYAVTNGTNSAFGYLSDPL